MDNYLSKQFSIGLHLGLYPGNYNTINTGLVDTEQNEVEIIINGLMNFGGELGYVLSYRFDILLGFDHQVSWLDRSYENGSGTFRRNILIPAVKYSPFISKKIRFSIGMGANAMLSSIIDVTAQLEEGDMHLNLNYKFSVGPLFLTEIECYFSDFMSISFSAKYNINKLNFRSGEFDNHGLLLNQLPEDARSFYSNCIFFNFTCIFHI